MHAGAELNESLSQTQRSIFSGGAGGIRRENREPNPGRPFQKRLGNAMNNNEGKEYRSRLVKMHPFLDHRNGPPRCRLVGGGGNHSERAPETRLGIGNPSFLQGRSGRPPPNTACQYSLRCKLEKEGATKNGSPKGTHAHVSLPLGQKKKTKGLFGGTGPLKRNQGSSMKIGSRAVREVLSLAFRTRWSLGDQEYECSSKRNP